MTACPCGSECCGSGATGDAIRIANELMIAWRPTLDWLAPHDGPVDDRCESVNRGDRCTLTTGHDGRHEHFQSFNWSDQ